MKVLKKISPERQKPENDVMGLKIAIDRVSQYNNFWKLSGRTKQSSDSGSKILIRKTNVSRKHREVNSNVNKSNFNLSGPVHVRDGKSMPFDSTILRAHQAHLARDTNKSQQLVFDTNSTLAYTGWVLSSKLNSNFTKVKNNLNRWILESVVKPQKTKFSPHELYFKRQK